MNSIKCTKCGEEIEISEALRHQIEENVLSDVKARHIKDLDLVRRETEEKLKKSIAEEMELKFKNKEEETKELRTRNKELMTQILDLNKLLRELKDRQERMEIENQKRLNEQIEKVKEENLKVVSEKMQFEMLELKKQLDDTKKALNDANTKLYQKSQQLQGEVMELYLENRLKAAFPHDEIIPVTKGAVGADILQKVKNSYSQLAGIILWETKRAKWTPSWLPKLREDGRKEGANTCILVCETMPKDITTFGWLDGILVCSYTYALPLAEVVRRGIIQIAIAKSGAVNKDEKLQSLYEYLQSETFRHRFEAYVEGIVAMQQDLETEKRSMQRLWKKREMEINKVLNSIANMYGELQGIMGSSLPEIKQLALPKGEDL